MAPNPAHEGWRAHAITLEQLESRLLLHRGALQGTAPADQAFVDGLVLGVMEEMSASLETARTGCMVLHHLYSPSTTEGGVSS